MIESDSRAKKFAQDIDFLDQGLHVGKSDAVRTGISSDPACFGKSVCKADCILLISPIFTGCRGHVQLIKLSISAPDPN